jgi:hypothetical protein
VDGAFFGGAVKKENYYRPERTLALPMINKFFRIFSVLFSTSKIIFAIRGKKYVLNGENMNMWFRITPLIKNRKAFI